MVNLRPFLDELDGFFFHTLVQGVFFRNTQLFSILAHVLGNFHGTEMRTTHRAEVRHFHALLGQGFIVEFTRSVWVQTQIELIIPAEFETGL